MTEVRDRIDDRLVDWIEAQPIFFVGTAPLDRDGHVNVSPKGPIGGLRVLDPNTIVYLDIVGSGAETIAHVRENGRIVVMLCAFDEPARVLRLHGRGRVIRPGDEDFADLTVRARFEEPVAREARRALVVVDVTRVTETPGEGVPLMRFESERTPAEEWASRKADAAGEDLVEFQREENAESLDGLPSVDWIDGERA